jgi:transaldolase/glucose-6-phosphate isomerase
LWAEQLIAESTGKEGRGIVPVANVVPNDPRDFDDDRFFVYLQMDKTAQYLDEQVNDLKTAGHAVMTLHLNDLYDLGGEFFRWELATAVAGHLLQINPFDQPNVQESKTNTRRLLDYVKEHGDLPEVQPILEEAGLKLYADTKTADTLRRIGEQRGFDYGDLGNLLLAHMSQARSGEYIAIMAYLAATDRHNELLEAIRQELRHATMRAITLGYGPRFLHSTGQLHKGGSNRAQACRGAGRSGSAAIQETAYHPLPPARWQCLRWARPPPRLDQNGRRQETRLVMQNVGAYIDTPLKILFLPCFFL